MRTSLIAGLVIILGVALVLLPAAAGNADANMTLYWLPLVYGPLNTTPVIPHVRIAPGCSRFNALGDDNHNLNDEYVCLENHGAEAVDMTGWRVRDATTRNYYVFPAFSLPSKATVKLHSGAGVDTDTDLYWGRTQAVWNNDGDIVSLYDDADILVDQYRYEEALESHGPTTTMTIS